MRHALEKYEAGNVEVVPIILRPTALWEKTPFGKLQALPRNGKAITTQRNRDAAFADIVKEISRIIAELPSRKQAGKEHEGIFPKFTQVIGSPCISCGARNLLEAAICEHCGDLLFAHVVTSNSYEEVHPSYGRQAMPVLLAGKSSGSIVQVRRPLNFALVIDHSGSMKGAKLKNVREAVKMVIDRLEPTDYISVVIFDDTTQVIIPSMPCNDKPGMKAAIDRIQDAGGRRMSLGMLQGLGELQRWNIPNAINRMMIVTDGVTASDADRCRQLAREAATKSISIYPMGIGSDWDEALLDDIGLLSGGPPANFIRSPADAMSIFEISVFENTYQ